MGLVELPLEFLDPPQQSFVVIAGGGGLPFGLIEGGLGFPGLRLRLPPVTLGRVGPLPLTLGRITPSRVTAGRAACRRSRPAVAAARVCGCRVPMRCCPGRTATASPSSMPSPRPA